MFTSIHVSYLVETSTFKIIVVTGKAGIRKINLEESYRALNIKLSFQRIKNRFI